jgi:glycosyltransferase involved in cell wall biosynthesis
LPLTLLSENS